MLWAVMPEESAVAMTEATHIAWTLSAGARPYRVLMPRGNPRTCATIKTSTCKTNRLHSRLKIA